jgi:kumamolisin
MSKPLPHSARVPVRGYRVVRSADPDQIIETTLVLRRVSQISDEDVIKMSLEPLSKRKYLTNDELAKRYGASPSDVDKVIEFANANGLAMVAQNLAARTVKLSGTVTAVQKAFGVDLKIYQNAAGTHSYCGRVGVVHVPDPLANVVLSVHGLDNREQAKAHFRMAPQTVPPRLKPTAHAAEKLTAFTPRQVATAYDFPPDATGKNQTIALIELGGGYKTADLDKYFQQFGANPKVSAASVDGGTNQPTGNGDGPDGEVVLDIEVSGSVASGASIVVYFANNTDKGFLDAVTQAIHDQTNNPSVVSISWGGPESNWTQQSMDSFNDAFKDASMLGVTVLVASGDDGSTDGLTDGAQHVDFPSSSPFVLACGGTQLVANGSTITDEITWGGTKDDGASGGGVSQHFPIPSYQNGILPKDFNGRGVPDVAGDADPQTGYQVLVDGMSAVIGGTSAVAPLYAGLVALLNESIGNRVGFLNPTLYSNASVCHDVVKGTNGAYNASSGWDATTGLGSINGTDLLAAFKKTKVKVA